MIISSVNSGLGNQMFQFACGRAVAARTGYDLALEGTALERDPQRKLELPRLFDLARFHICEQQMNEHAQRSIGFLSRRINRHRDPLSHGFHSFQERRFTFDPSVFKVADNTILRGYWQSEKYFAPIAEVVRKDFTFVVEPDTRNAELIDELSNTCSIALHVRRGDYVSDPEVAKRHGICAPEYYQRAVTHMIERLDAPHFYVFSDDPDWVRANLHLPYPIKYVTWNRGDRSFEDMRLMSACQHNIIANSSFSWWGAWLNRHAEKIVIAPVKWFGTISHDTQDLVPDSWTRL